MNCSKYYYVALNVQSNISFVYTQLNGLTVLFLNIQFNISHSLIHSFNVKLFYLIHRKNPIRCYHFRPEWTLEQWQWRVTLHFPKLQHYWSLTIRLFSVISRILIGGGVWPLNRGVFYSLSQLGCWQKEVSFH